MGFNESEIVKELSQRHSCSERAVYYDFEKRAEWQPILQKLEGQTAILMKTVNRYEQIYRLAAFKFLTGSNESVQLGGLKLMAEINGKIRETACMHWLHKEPEKIDQIVQGMPWRQHPITQQILIKYEKILLAEKNGIAKISAPQA